MNTDFIIRNETESDFHSTEDLVRNSFWNVYKPGCSEHFVLHELRKSKNFVPELDFVMEKDSKLIGQIVFVKAKIFCDDGTEKNNSYIPRFFSLLKNASSIILYSSGVQTFLQ